VADVILPVLDEAGALPGVLEAMPDGYRPIVVDNGSSDGSGEIAAGLGAEVVHEPKRGFGAACYAGLLAATADVVCFMDCDGSLDASELPRVAGPVIARDADLVLGRRLAERGAWPLHSRIANAFLGRELRRRSGVEAHDLGPMRAMRRADILALGIEDRRFGWPLEMVLRAGAAGWRVREVPVGYAPRIGRSKVTGTLRGTARAIRDMSRALRDVETPARLPLTLVVIAKEPVPGRSKTRLAPALGADGAAAAAEAALRDTLRAVAAVPAHRRVLALDGDVGDWLPAGFDVVSQPEGGLDERLAAAVEAASGPVLVVGMDTPQMTPVLVRAAIDELLRRGTDAVIGPATDGGYWAIGLREPNGALLRGVPMSTSETGAQQRQRLTEAGLAVRELQELRDVDEIDDAVAVAALCPGSEFATKLDALLERDGKREWTAAG
jgi:rSAM/selenodomain-associated transferase 1